MWKQWQTNLILQRLCRLLQRSDYIHDHFNEIKMSCYNFKALHPFKPLADHDARESKSVLTVSAPTQQGGKYRPSEATAASLALITASFESDIQARTEQFI
ncbi:hypothetical protein Tsp_12039 [Trichinella spiralis]|uniref:Uncharacterized protein n=1 Tax=Trichinella spiralis TaxID=6334 RepID=E5S8C3_TRISP|nr:hypothetical protein Tsp_12039 [Trichinella spiralis]KRY30748.1 hypothetical protein T01_9709 [Trichinella spiralis]